MFLAAGHELGGGASSNGLTESPYNALVAVLAVRNLRAGGIEAHLAPLTSRGYPHDIHAKTAWISQRAGPRDLAVDVHLDIGEPGCAAFAIEDSRMLALADLIAERLARETGLRCRGGMPEGQTGPGRLGFLHALPCPAVLVELCSMNTTDSGYAKHSGARARFARGLARGCSDALELI